MPTGKAKPKKLTRAELAAAAARAGVAVEKRKRLQAAKRTKSADEKAKSEAYLDDERVDRRDGKGQARKFRRGNPGRPKGAKDVEGRTVRASVKAIMERVVRREDKTIDQAMVRALKARKGSAPTRMIQILAAYTDGKPPETINVNSQWNTEELDKARENLTKQLTTMFSRLEEKLPTLEETLADKS